MTYRDAIGAQRFESCKTANKKDAEQRLIDRRKEAQEGLAPAASIKPLALEDLQARYLSFWAINGEWQPSSITSPTSSEYGVIIRFIP